LQYQVTTTAKLGSYAQVRITGDFLSTRKAAWVERCTPKTNDAELAG